MGSSTTDVPTGTWAHDASGASVQNELRWRYPLARILVDVRVAPINSGASRNGTSNAGLPGDATSVLLRLATVVLEAVDDATGMTTSVATFALSSGG